MDGDPSAVIPTPRERLSTSHKLSDLLQNYLSTISHKCRLQPQLVIKAWHKVVGESFASMTKAIRFDEGVLLVHVSNSTLMSILNRTQDKERLRKALQDLVPGVEVRSIVFRIG